jgi:cellobiose phosphorylase
MTKEFKVNYFTSNLPISSFETDRKIFLGDNEYGTFASPLSLQQAELSSFEALRGDNISALMHHLGVLQPGESKRLITQLGQTENIKKALPDIAKYRDGKQVEQALQKIADFWNEYLSKQQVKTPDASMNSMINVHNPRQCYITKNWSRYLSLYQLGFGGRGIGFRDSSQDMMGILANRPEEAKSLIRMLMHVQKRNGSAMHQLNPLTMVATEGDSREFEDRPKYYGDDHLWLILAITAYLKETNDQDFLAEVIPYYEKDKNEKPLESGTVLDHLIRAIEFTQNDLGKHGLPLLGFADWNDTVNLPTGAESLFIANQYGWALLEMIELLKYVGDDQTAAKYEKYYAQMKKNVNDQAWDGEWYVRYFDHDGSPLGSKQNKQGQIYINAQSWAVLSGFASRERAVKALASVNKRLNTKNGIKISAPAFNGFDHTKGGITTYPPGAKENGGIFLHTNPWVMIAETMLGNGDRAYEYYSQINPATKNDKMEEFECEPYSYPQNILGDEHPQFGLGRNSWLSGTSAWTYQAATKYILGIRPEYASLTIDPCIPKEWPGFSVVRVFRGATYNIYVSNPEQVSKGVKEIKVDGSIMAKVPVFNDSGVHKVEIIMGRSS